ncbi:MAG: hypothetical protein J6R20_08260 [Clostridia bacterium]|nr:hypothetical protein [Clostridia bacterium]
MKILAIGEIIFDIFGYDAVIGGAPLNFCAHCVASGADAALISGVGNDEFGEKALAYLEKFGVDSRFVSTVSGETGKCIVTVTNGNPSYNVMRPAAYDMLEADTKLISDYAADVFAFGTLIQRETKSRKAVKDILSDCRFNHIFCDVNLRKNCYDEESCRLCLENATILKLSSEEEPLLSEFGFYESAENEKELLENIAKSFGNIRLILFTKCENGSAIYDARSGEIVNVSAEKVQIVSTVGAGDSYSAAFLCEYLQSGDIAKAGKKGAALSAHVVSYKEAIPK